MKSQLSLKLILKPIINNMIKSEKSKIQLKKLIQ